MQPEELSDSESEGEDDNESEITGPAKSLMLVNQLVANRMEQHLNKNYLRTMIDVSLHISKICCVRFDAHRKIRTRQNPHMSI